MTIDHKKWMFRIVAIAMAIYLAVLGAYVWGAGGFGVFAIYAVVVAILLGAAWRFGEFVIERFN